MSTKGAVGQLVYTPVGWLRWINRRLLNCPRTTAPIKYKRNQMATVQRIWQAGPSIWGPAPALGRQGQLRDWFS